MDAFGGIDDFDEVDCEDSDVIEFDREFAEKLYREGFYTTDPARWERVREVIPFDELVSEIHGTHTNVISCPFHGRDSKPSFNIYRRTNDAYCFGCAEGERYYDAVRFVAAKFDISRKDALTWLERKYDLPPLPDIQQDPEHEERVEVEVTYRDLAPAYRAYAALSARTALQNSGTPRDRRAAMMAEAFAYVYFANEPDKPTQDAPGLPLAQVLGNVRTAKVLSEKVVK